MKHKQSTHVAHGSKGFARPRQSDWPRVESLFADAFALHRAGRLEDAKRIYAKVLAVKPDHFGSHHLLGLISGQQGNHAAALGRIDSALKIDPTHAVAWISRGNALHALKRFDEALVSCDRALALRPDYAEAYYNRGNSLYEMKRFDEALLSYDRAISKRPDYIEALCNRGIVLNALGRLEEALASYDRALAIRSDYVEALANRGVTLHELKRFEAALASYDRALGFRPDYTEAHFNRGATLNALQRFGDALACYDRALALRSDDAEAMTNRGIALHQLRRFEESVASYDGALAVWPDYSEAHFHRGNALHGLHRFNEALESYDRALTLRPDLPELHAGRGNVLSALGRFEEALTSYDRALMRRPDWAQAQFDRGNTLFALKLFEDAVASYDRALTLRADYVEALYNRGNALNVLKRFQEALASYDKAIALRPDHAEALANRGVALHELQRFDEAVASYARAVSVRPDYAEAHFNEALCLLLTGRFERGWEKHEWRWQTDLFRRSKREFVQPLWVGSDEISGKTVLLHAEQGLGDTIQFCRYAPLLAQRGAHVILEVQKPVAQLMNSLPHVGKILSRGETLPHFDLHCPLLSLPLAFKTNLVSIPREMPYLSAPAAKIAAWRDRLGTRERPRIGLVWAGNPRKELPGANRIDAQRSITFDRLAPLLQETRFEFYSLQKGEAAVAQLHDSALCQQVCDWTDDLHDFSDTAALIENLDLVISVDTAVAHLAGALGKPFWLINRYNTCWRWLLERDDSPWYPTARVFRQDETRDWNDVIIRIRDALRACEFRS